MSADPKIEERERVIWGREEPGARRTSLSRDKIAEAALKVADEEGFDAVSMRRVAKELGAGTMTLYHYVVTKEELVTLMADRMMGELLVPDDELSTDWREAITQVANRTRDIFRNHPWTLENMQGSRGGPNGMRHFEQSLKAVEGTGASALERLDIVSMVDDFVFGFVMRESAVKAWSADPNQETDSDEWSDDMVEFFEDQLSTGEFPHIASLQGDGDREESMKRIAEMGAGRASFERRLSRLLDGIEVALGK